MLKTISLQTLFCLQKKVRIQVLKGIRKVLQNPLPIQEDGFGISIVYKIIKKENNVMGICKKLRYRFASHPSE